jgi:hypothetical protein
LIKKFLKYIIAAHGILKINEDIEPNNETS